MMPANISQDDSFTGISDHGGWAVLVTATRDGVFLDRRQVELVDPDLPKIPHHSEAQSMPLAEAAALIERVRTSAERHSRLVLDALAADFPGRIRGIALRRCPPLPATVAERITDYHARNNADWVMYREALAAAAEARGWLVHWFDAKKALAEAGEIVELRRQLGPPWTQDHKIALAGALRAAERD